MRSTFVNKNCWKIFVRGIAIGEWVLYPFGMKNKKLSKLAIVASSAMLLAGCENAHIASIDMRVAAVENKLAAMGPEASDAYIREKMDGLYKFHFEGPTALNSKKVKEGLFLDLWAESDTNGTFIDEYANLMRQASYAALEYDVTEKAVAKYKAEKKQAKLQRRMDKTQRKIDKIQDKIDAMGISTTKWDGQVASDELTK